MRLGLKLLNTDATVNNFKYLTFLSVARGETFDILFQLVDLEKEGHRFVPATGATVEFQMNRSIEVVPDPAYQGSSRLKQDNSIIKPAIKAFSGDDSIWKVSINATDSAKLISNSIRVVLTQGTDIKIASLNAAVKIMNGQDE